MKILHFDTINLLQSNQYIRDAGYFFLKIKAAFPGKPR